MTHYYIGIDLGGTNIKSAVFDSQFHTVLERSDPTEAAKGPAHVLGSIKRIVQEMLGFTGIQQEEIQGMGMGIPGLLDPESGLSIFSPNFPEWNDIQVVDEMQRDFRFPVFIDNDVRVNLYGEWLFGAAAGYRNVCLITLGTGLGSGLVVDGKVFYGTTASAGEIGHMNMYREGRPCRCGSSGCLGRYVSALGMVRTFTEKLAEGHSSIVTEWIGHDSSRITARMISEAYDAGDALAIDVLHETGTLLGFGLSNVINLINPEIIVVGGGMAAAGDRLLGITREVIGKHALNLSSRACTVVQARLGERAGMIGAAAYAKERMSRKFEEMHR